MVQLKDNIAINIGSTTINLVFVEGGIFQMGGDQMDREKPIHEVSMPSFYMARYLVTQQLYQEIIGTNPSRRIGRRKPVEKVSWEETRVFMDDIQKRKELNQLQRKFRLPTESEWEYAARGGKYSEGYEYAGSDNIKQVGWYNVNSGRETKPVGLLQPNELGLYDMSGNVYEWCEDNWHEDYNSSARPDNGSGWIDISNRGTHRVIRGGASLLSPVSCRSAYRYRNSPGYRNPIIGFRLVLSQY